MGPLHSSRYGVDLLRPEVHLHHALFVQRYFFENLMEFPDLRVNDIIRMAYSERKKKITEQQEIGEVVYKKFVDVLEKRNLADKDKLHRKISIFYGT